MHLTRFLARRAAALVAAGGLCAVLGVALPATPAVAAGPTITGTGSSYAAVAIDQWVSQVQTLYGDSVNYQTSSDVIGLNDYAQNQVDFGASEIGYSTGQANNEPTSGTYQYLPDVAGATCLMYNLTSSVDQHLTNLRLDPAVMTGIFTGTITRWNAPAIVALNPGVALPSQPIVVVFRTDASGENYLFSDYLNQLEPSDWAGYTKGLGFADAPEAIWPYPQSGTSPAGYNFSTWVGQSGSDNASDYVGATPDSITYVETAYALLHNEPCAAIRNPAGDYVQPSELGDAVALERDQLLPDLEQKLTGVYDNPLPQSYPISAYSYLLVPLEPKGSISAAKGKVLGQFVNYLACAGQQAAGQLGYSPLPPNLVQEDLLGIRKITGAATPAPLSASSCRNPYVDGQTPLPGEPTIAGGVTVPASVTATEATSSGGTGVNGGASTGGAATGGTGAGTSAAGRAGAHGATSGAAGAAGNAAHQGAGAESTSGPDAAGANSIGGSGDGSGAGGLVGSYPGQQIVAGYGVGKSLPGGDDVGVALVQAAGKSAAGGLTAGGVLAAVLVAAALAIPGCGLVRRRRARRTAMEGT